MKRIIIIIAAFTAILASATSCEEWLEATASTKLPAGKMFETRGGFCDALSGVYINMGGNTSGTYHSYWTWNYADMVAYPYVYSSSALMKIVQLHSYQEKRMELAILAMWRMQYNSIANINLALESLDAVADPGAVFHSAEEYNLIKGEFLGLRAYLHFDLMRLFGIADFSGENLSKLTIPYVTSFTKEPTPQKSYSDTFGMILSDIEEALSLMEESDPVAGKIDSNVLKSMNEDGYWNDRYYHLNYYAIKALAARVYQWKGDLSKAAEYASDAIDGALGSGLVSWVNVESILSDSQDDMKDWSFSTEHIFSLQVMKLTEDASMLFITTGSTAEYIISQELVDNILFVRQDPETGSLAGTEDLRGPAFMLKFTAQGYKSYKLYAGNGSPFRNHMPMLKISEMYYILAENAIASGDNAAAIGILNEVRSHRGISDDLPSDTDAADVLMKEYYREFINEGQLIYWLKHNNVKESLLPSFKVSADELIFPYPTDEINYGRVQEL